MPPHTLSITHRLPHSANYSRGEFDLSIFPAEPGAAVEALHNTGPTENGLQWHRGTFASLEQAIVAAAEFTEWKIWEVVNPAFPSDPISYVATPAEPPKVPQYGAVRQVGFPAKAARARVTP